ncbi:MAG: hypothetical protein PWQ06_1956 [Anaerophaga sp.]|nr:hypothetical protein [Anaerophaga sp.]
MMLSISQIYANYYCRTNGATFKTAVPFKNVFYTVPIDNKT